MLRTEASLSSLKDGYVFCASLQLSLSQGNTHTKKMGSFKKCTKTTNFFLREEEMSIEKRGWGKKEENEERATAVLYKSVCTSVQLLRNFDVSFLSSGCIMEHYGKGCYSARLWMEMLPHYFLLGPSSWGSHSESWTGGSYSVFLSRRC